MKREAKMPILAERDVKRQVCDFLEWRNWRPIRNQVSVSQNAAGGWFRTGENGMADYLFLRYLDDKPGAALALWVELKREGKPRRPDQVKWQLEETLRGALVVTVDRYEDFEQWYYQTFGWLHGPEGAGQQRLPLD